AAARQVKLDGRNWFAGQLAEEPVQVSATSQTSAAARQVKLDGRNAFAGQLPEEPVQVSATSQSPAEARHVWPALGNLHCEVQQEAGAPSEPPRSHGSPTELSTTPLPQSEVQVTVTKWPSLPMVRLGLPLYPQAEQSVVVPF